MTSSFLRLVSLAIAAACWLHGGSARADASPFPSCGGECDLDECSDRGVECWYERGEEGAMADFDRCASEAEARGWEYVCEDPAIGVTVYCEPDDGCRMSRKNERGFLSALVAFGLGAGITAIRARRFARDGR